MLRIIAITGFILFVAGIAQAEEIVLKTGMTISGSIIERSDTKIKVHTSGLEVTYYTDEILSIDGRAFQAPVPVGKQTIDPPQLGAPAVAEKVLEPPPQDKAGHDLQQDMGSAALELPESNAQTDVVYSQSDAAGVMVQESSKRSVRKKKLTSAQLATVGMITLSIVGLIFVLACYPVFLIAKKTNAPYAFYAFIPILNYYLLCKIAGRPVWWMVLYFVPFVGLAIDVIVWMDIAQVRQKPNWLGILILVPLVNLGMMWYLALSDQ